MIAVSLPDGSSLSVEKGSSLTDVATALGLKTGRFVAGKVDGELVDLGCRLTGDCEVKLLGPGDDEALRVLRHSAAHLMAHAVCRLFPGARLGTGPATDDGFFYDFELPRRLTPEDLPAIEREMAAIAKEKLALNRVELSRDEARARLEAAGQAYKVEIVNEAEEDVFSFYEQGDFSDLCRGPHVPGTAVQKAFRLLGLAGAYWRGIETNPMLQRVYGTAFFKQKDLDEYLRMREEAKKRDHRRIGRDLGLFSFHEEGPGFPFWHPKGMVVWNCVVGHWRQKHEAAGYREIRSPIILNRELWERSGHWENYRANMYFTEIDEQPYAVKPMNCPGGILVYKSTLHSYRDFPLKMAELGLVHRHELSGVLHGLFRVRSFTQDDAHIYCLPEQVRQQVPELIDFFLEMYRDFGFTDCEIELSTRPAKSIGSDADWENAESALHAALEAKDIPYRINKGEGAFYGPKIDFHIRDCMGRGWQCGTIQLDFAMPERFDLTYVGADGARHRPVMIHRALLGSLERFIGILIEHYAGALPTWLAPEQVVVLPITDNHVDYARGVETALRAAGVRCRADARNEKPSYKIREATMQKVPYMLVVGDREVEAGTVSVRRRKGGDQGAQPLDRFLQDLRREIDSRALPDA